ncbi:hypothetical protein CLV45_4690 [Hymenobacter chitinivorans DSM 11115]|uniref:Uncharacterized protein n=1 Tax=Hymenobacter chitinivorans DSM 11115 TaxID=1121954 RepID=A0A2M9AQM8_9BACT|nr:hypothetical protein CLV45_4690 [Hymenobacter chitinivorans DSM 11115]
MAQATTLVALPPGRAQHVHTTYDSFGAVVAEYTFFPRNQVLYVRWHGHMTSDELVRAAQVGLRLNQQWQPLGLFHDTRGGSGEWGEASAWIEYEWMPKIKAKCPNLRGIAFLLAADRPWPYSNTQLLMRFDQQFESKVFYSLLPAWRWLDQCTRQLAVPQ